MRKIISSVVILIFLSFPVYSQNTDSTKNVSDFSRKHRWAVQFGVDYNLRVVSFNGVLVSLKYHLSGKSAIRFGVGYTGNRETGRTEHTECIGTNSGETFYVNNNVSLVSNYVNYVKTVSRFNVYWGIGPAGRFSYSYDESPENETGDLLRASERKSWQAGLNAIFGVEWMPYQDFSLFAEYEASGFYGKSNYLYERYVKNLYYIEKTTEDIETWTFEGNTARLGLSVYFDKFF